MAARRESTWVGIEIEHEGPHRARLVGEVGAGHADVVGAEDAAARTDARSRQNGNRRDARQRADGLGRRARKKNIESGVKLALLGDKRQDGAADVGLGKDGVALAGEAAGQASKGVGRPVRGGDDGLIIGEQVGTSAG
jgi:hypothetical protein